MVLHKDTCFTYNLYEKHSSPIIHIVHQRYHALPFSQSMTPKRRNDFESVLPNTHLMVVFLIFITECLHNVCLGELPVFPPELAAIDDFSDGSPLDGGFGGFCGGF